MAVFSCGFGPSLGGLSDRLQGLYHRSRENERFNYDFVAAKNLDDVGIPEVGHQVFIEERVVRDGGFLEGGIKFRLLRKWLKNTSLLHYK